MGYETMSITELLGEKCRLEQEKGYTAECSLYKVEQEISKRFANKPVQPTGEVLTVSYGNHAEARIEGYTVTLTGREGGVKSIQVPLHEIKENGFEHLFSFFNSEYLAKGLLKNILKGVK